MLQPSKEESIRLALAQAEQHAEKKKWKAAIGALNQALDKGISNDKLLLQKGLLLGKTHQFKEAQKVEPVAAYAHRSTALSFIN